jgi:DNA-directed RNA polymerase subunit RPC12/RpoP
MPLAPPVPSTIRCSNCSNPMTSFTLDGHAGTEVVIDLCTACQVMWFDQHESLKLAPASTLRLLRLIGDRTGSKPPIDAVLRCPRCRSHLLATHDRQGDTPFTYWRCNAQHGRLITFFNFLREKRFIRVLSPAQIEELRRNVQTVNCSNCGGPIDLARGTTCPHCGSALSILDMKQAGQLIEQLRAAAAPKPIDPALGLNLIEAKRQVEAAFASIEGNPTWWRDASASGLVEAGLSAFARWLGRDK